MKQPFLILPAILISLLLQAQPKKQENKYPSLLWEISGKGLKQPSYLIGTMHVSSKLAFHLSDSFYTCIKKAQVVALETNPESWQEDMSKFDLNDDNADKTRFGNLPSAPNDFLNINTLKFYKYDKKIERALYSNPSTINNLLYRTYGNESSDFEEDTYLDMYIFQCGKKWGKNVTGVENYGESMKLMAEAYKDAAKDKNRKERSYDGEDGYSADKIQEAYRSGNLDLLDSINHYNSFSEAFDEKFLYKRNENQARSIDSIIHSGSSLFVGVGAAHLPGRRGVIELLRKMGYKLRPVKMGERDSRDKEQVEKLRVPVSFRTETADDGLFKVDIPGKFYKFGDDEALDQKQYADMANGSYYMVTRIMTNAWMWGQTTEQVFKTVDSLLYENVPGRIISRSVIYRNGYKGLDITNRTRRGDLQRYNIFVTPFEIIFFKMGGNGDYVKNGDEAKKFFGSIQFRTYKSAKELTTDSWHRYSPSYGGFAIDLPHEPYIGNDGSWIFDAEDYNTGTQYRLIRSDIHNYHFVEVDSFDLGLMEESFAASDFIDKQIGRSLIHYKGYPALDCQFKDKNGSIYLARFVICGPHYYTLVAHGKKEIPAMKNFLNSFELKPYNYDEAKTQIDTTLYFTVNTPVYPENKKIRLDTRSVTADNDDEDDDSDSEDDQLGGGAYRNKTIGDDTTGEEIYVTFSRFPKYYFTSDSSALDNANKKSILGDTSWLIRSRKSYPGPDGLKINEFIASAKGSSRAIWSKSYYRDGMRFNLLTETDTLSAPSSFVRNFYDSFHPGDTLKGLNPFERKSAVFFNDLESSDSSDHQRAVSHITDIDLDSTDLSRLEKSIDGMGWGEKKYLDTKKALIGKLGDIQTTKCSDYLKRLYYSLEDTVELEYAALESLLQQQTKYSFGVFRDIIIDQAPVLEKGTAQSGYSFGRIYHKSGGYDNGSFMDELFDTLELTRTILPGLLPLLDLNDYKFGIMKLLSKMIDSGLVKKSDYEKYVNKFLIEAKQEMRKQIISEKKKAIAKAEQGKEGKKSQFSYSDNDRDEGNEDLSLYAALLLPCSEIQPGVNILLNQMLASNDKQMKYNTMMLLVRNKKAIPDTLMPYFAGLDDYRYELYTDLKRLKKLDLFPAKNNNHIDLGRSALLQKKSFSQPDSLIYVDKMKTAFNGRKGLIYFYKYKMKKDDLSWKLAAVGLLPEDLNNFDFPDEEKTDYSIPEFLRISASRFSSYDFTRFTETKISEDEPIAAQLTKALKRILYSRKKSAQEFYDEESDPDDPDLNGD